MRCSQPGPPLKEPQWHCVCGPVRRPGLKSAILNTAPVRRFAARRMRARAEEKAPHDQYPAPYALIDLWERHGGSRAVMMAVEKPSFARLAVTSTAQNLVRMFFLREQMKQSGGAP